MSEDDTSSAAPPAQPTSTGRWRSKTPDARYVKIEYAAALLQTTPCALRARCRRASRRKGDRVVASLGAGITAEKLGSSWRVLFPREEKDTT